MNKKLYSTAVKTTRMRPTNTMERKRIEKIHISFKNRQKSNSIRSHGYGHHLGQVTRGENNGLLGGCSTLSTLSLDLGADYLGVTKQIENRI